jgi:hypothetical protein
MTMAVIKNRNDNRKWTMVAQYTTATAGVGIDGSGTGGSVPLSKVSRINV